MKPTLELEKPMPATVIIQPDNTDTGRKSPMKRWAVGIVLGLVAAIVITAIVLVSLHFGAKVTRDSYKEALVTFNGVRGDEKVTEKITVTENEEDVEVPREFRIIFDYAKGLAVMQFNSVKDETDGVCYVTRFNVTSGDIDKIREEMQSDVMERTMTSDPGEQSYESSGEAADRGLLSPRASEMCRHHPLYWARETTETGVSTGRRRRQAANCFYRYYLYGRFNGSGYDWYIIRVKYCYR